MAKSILKAKNHGEASSCDIEEGYVWFLVSRQVQQWMLSIFILKLCFKTDAKGVSQRLNVEYYLLRSIHI